MVARLFHIINYIMKLINRLTNNWVTILSIVFCAAVMCSSCGGSDNDEDTILDNEENEVKPDADMPDPTGTVTLSLRDKDNGYTYLGNIYITNENFSGYLCHFSSLGKVKGLGNVANIPTTGWVSQIAVKPGHGYVAYDGMRNKYYRIFVTDYIVSTLGGIIGAEIKYQEPFYGKDEAISLDVQSLTFSADGGEQTLIFNKSGVVVFDVKSDKFAVEKASTYDQPFLTNGIAVKAEPNMSPNPIEGTITLTTHCGKKTVIKVTQAGKEPFIHFDEANLNVSAATQTRTITMSGNIPLSNLTASSSTSWCKAELIGNSAKVQTKNSKVKFIGDKPAKPSKAAQSDQDTEYSLSVSIDENPSSTQRTATITVKSKDGKTSATLNVMQEGSQLTCNDTQIGFDKNAGYHTTTINTTAVNWEAESSADWCTFSKNGNQLTIRVTKATEDRTATISFKGFDTKITVHQSKYAVGDNYNENGIEGIVGYIGDNARYIYKYLGTTAWSTENVETGANSKDDGEYNMNVIKRIPHWEDFYPAFQLCNQLNTNGVTGWYLPAINELLLLEVKNPEREYWWSSTEVKDFNDIYAYRRWSFEDRYGYNSDKSQKYQVFAVRKF